MSVQRAWNGKHWPSCSGHLLHLIQLLPPPRGDSSCLRTWTRRSPLVSCLRSASLPSFDPFLYLLKSLCCVRCLMLKGFPHRSSVWGAERRRDLSAAPSHTSADISPETLCSDPPAHWSGRNILNLSSRGGSSLVRDAHYVHVMAGGWCYLHDLQVASSASIFLCSLWGSSIWV